MEYKEYGVNKDPSNMINYAQNEVKQSPNKFSQSSVEISGNSKALQQYQKYCKKCEAKNKKPVPMTTWLARKGFAAAAGVGLAGVGGAVAYSQYKKKKKLNEDILSYYEGYLDGILG